MTYSSLLKLVCHNKTRNIRIIETERKLWNQTTVYEPSTYFFYFVSKTTTFQSETNQFFKIRKLRSWPSSHLKWHYRHKIPNWKSVKENTKTNVAQTYFRSSCNFLCCRKVLMLSFSLKKFLPDQSSKITVKLDKI